MTTPDRGKSEANSSFNFGIISENSTINGAVQNAPFGRHNIQHVHITTEAELVAAARQEATKVQGELKRLLADRTTEITLQDRENAEAALRDVEQVDASLEGPDPGRNRLRYAFDNLWRRCDAITAGITTIGLLQTAVLAILNA